ncbi:MAG: acyl-CoA thioesterase II [Sphingopyxis sp.]|uniref:acyl-CoA thioesterase n=1 Tax=Sphingopyxis sp. TaxID=1908224 RepID=UPI001A490272|nr:acyl-CoA thioesterase II [Sphingopyxis sp.]MBL9071473.1 acyl-CoA thioesterase II [Sphingopyxis sp.]
MSLTPDEIQARVDRAREIQSAFSPEKVVAAVTRLFDLERVPGLEDEFTFPAFNKPTRQRIFGGQVIAQALVAAARTVDPAKTAHSLHAYFLRGGDEAKPLHFRVHRDFDGRSFANRRVVVRQDGKVIFNLTASFHAPEPGAAHQAPMPDVLPPEECAEFVENLAADPNVSDAQLDRMARLRPFEIRSFRPSSVEKGTTHYQWYRLAAPIGDDPLLHRAFLAYASDMGLLSSSLLPHGFTWSTPGLFSTSLDHAMWFHDDVRADQWFVYVMDSDWTGASRGINRGLVYRQDGTLIASAMQEGLLRITRPEGDA